MVDHAGVNCSLTQATGFVYIFSRHKSCKCLHVWQLLEHYCTSERTCGFHFLPFLHISLFAFDPASEHTQTFFEFSFDSEVFTFNVKMSY